MLVVLGATTLTVACNRSDDDDRRRAERDARDAREEAERARREAEEAKKEAAQAKTGQTALEADTRAAEEKAAKEAAAARDARLRLAKQQAPSKVAVQQLGCYCAQGGGIAVSCSVTNGAEVPVAATINFGAQTGFLGINGSGSMVVSVPARSTVVQQGVTHHKTNLECASATGCSCSVAAVEAK